MVCKGRKINEFQLSALKLQGLKCIFMAQWKKKKKSGRSISNLLVWQEINIVDYLGQNFSPKVCPSWWERCESHRNVMYFSSYTDTSFSFPFAKLLWQLLLNLFQLFLGAGQC